MQLGQFWTRYKKTKTSCHFWVEQKAGCTNHHPGGGQTTKRLLAKIPGPDPLAYLTEGTSLLPFREWVSKGTCYLVFPRWVSSTSTVKPCLKDSPGTQDGNRETALKSWIEIILPLPKLKFMSFFAIFLYFPIKNKDFHRYNTYFSFQKIKLEWWKTFTMQFMNK